MRVEWATPRRARFCSFTHCPLFAGGFGAVSPRGVGAPVVPGRSAGAAAETRGDAERANTAGTPIANWAATGGPAT